MAIEKTYLEWLADYQYSGSLSQKEFIINLGDDEDLQNGLYLSPAPVVKLHHLKSQWPETWEDYTSLVTFENLSIVDDEENGREDCAISFTIKQKAQWVPTPGDDYSFLIVCSRSDSATIKVVRRFWLRILP